MATEIGNGNGHPQAVHAASPTMPLEEDEMLKRIIERHLPSRDNNKILTKESRLRDFGIDSLLSVVLSLEIQEFYNIEFPIGTLGSVMFGTLGELQETVRELVREAAGA
jgi:acyl carrier protein